MSERKGYPIKFKPILEKTVWQGSALKKFRKIDDNNSYGISWEVSAHPNATNEIINGYYQGRTLLDVLSDNPKEILGNKVNKDQVHRVSYINADDNLSVQVHPADKYLEQNEIWYVLEAPKDSKVIVGTRAKSTEELRDKIKSDEIESILKTMSIEVGDFIYIPGGLVHALTKGVTVLEIGQNHDNTFRLYDYNRGREIHVEKSLRYTKFDVQPIKTHITKDKKTHTKEIAYEGDDFTVEIIEGIMEYKSVSDVDRYYVYTNIGEDCKIVYGKNNMDFEKGESVLIPAYLGEYSILGNLKLIKNYVSIKD